MRVVHTIAELRTHLAEQPGCSFVPTMGNLHDGHLSLIRAARERANPVVVSIFVNPLQFAPTEDFESYPRTFGKDCELLRTVGCDVVFAPDVPELYPTPQTFKVEPPARLADILEGEFRPGFFAGVCTVVLKLLNCVQPRVALFGKKDYQQLMIVREMVWQMGLPVEVASVETTRADDGLALSSRNGRLSDAERSEAVTLSRELRAIVDAIRNGSREVRKLEAAAMATLRSRGWQPDYVAIRRQSDLSDRAWDQGSAPSGSLVVLGAATLGATRLIDNFEVPVV